MNWTWLFFTLFFVYEELLLMFAAGLGSLATVGNIVISALALGSFLTLLLSLIRNKRANMIWITVVLALVPVMFLAEIMCKEFFGTYYGVGYMLGMVGDVAGDFKNEAIHVIVTNIWRVPLAYLPLILFLIPRIRKHLRRPKRRLRLVILLIMLLSLAGTHFVSKWTDKSIYGSSYTMNTGVPCFGLMTSLRLEIQYAIFGLPDGADELGDLDIDFPVVATPEQTTALETPEETGTPDATAEETTEATTEAPIVYGYNAMDIDFAALAANATKDSLKSMHEFFANLTPTQQNEYTGMFAGKNLIFLTAEAFSPYVISEELTPTLYKLSHEGFVFNNYYQPSWFQSTTGGEFANVTGLTATWVGQKLSFTASANCDMPFALGNQFRKIGYNTLAYHNNSYTYYNRDKTHPNLGYDFYGIGNGLELPSSAWPCSDLEMMQATVPGYIQKHLETGVPFHTYYMTVSGHCNYSWASNDMSKKNRDLVAHLPFSETVQAYIACNLELEAAMTYLLEQLENAGIADDTVIVMGADHYPYAMTQNSPVDYYNELSGMNDSEAYTSRYRNTLILWSGSMEEPVIVDTPCSAIDIVPTISNLFGLEYDSRLFAGTDVFATNFDPLVPSFNMPLVIFIDGGFGTSWSTVAGTYEAKDKTFYPNPGYENIPEGFVKNVTKIATTKHSTSRLIIANDYYGVVVPD